MVLAFKANIDDLRQSPSLNIARALAQEYRGQVVAIEPNITKLEPEDSDLIRLVDLNEAFSTATIEVLLVDHKEFISFAPRNLEEPQYIIDTKGIWIK